MAALTTFFSKTAAYFSLLALVISSLSFHRRSTRILTRRPKAPSALCPSTSAAQTSISIHGKTASALDASD